MCDHLVAFSYYATEQTKKYLCHLMNVDELPEDLAEDSLPEDGIMRQSLLDSLAAALEKLPSELTDIVVLRYYDRIPLTEIADKLGMSYGMVKIRHNKALSLLRAALA